MDFCCTNCFQDEWLIEHIKKNGEQIDKCYFCLKENVRAIKIERFDELIKPLLKIYTAVTNYYPMSMLKELHYPENMIWGKLTDDWEIFDDSSIGESILSSLYQDNLRDGTDYDVMNDPVGIKDDWYGDDYDQFNLWKKFCYEIRHVNRFAPKSFAGNIIDQIIQANEKTITPGTILYRARIQKSPKPFSREDMGPPPVEKATFGRLNPQGIAYLYLSENQDTCIFEIRPDTTDKISLGTFSVINKCKMVDLTSGYIGSPFKWGESFPIIYCYKKFLKEFGLDISKPINPKSSYLDYLPTQFVSEYIKNKGYNGIIFKSSSGRGLNYILFNHEFTKCSNVKSVGNIKINYTFS